MALRTATLLLALAVVTSGCEPAPVPLPEPLGPPATGQRVRVPGVDAYLARPGGPLQERPATLLATEDLGPEAQQAALSKAETGRTVLAIGPDSDEQRARSYLEGLPDSGPVASECLASRCR